MLFGVLGLLAAPIHASLILYVDDDAAPGGDGHSWAGAFDDLQAALGIVQSGDVIHIAQGTYAPAGPGGSRSARFEVQDGVAILGGYAGLAAGEIDPDTRDTQQFITILTGDLDHNDRAGFANYGDNSYHVVYAVDIADPDTRLDGLTITGGNANGPECCFDWRGAGVYLVRAPMTINDCAIVANIADNAIARGGGMYIVTDSDATITNCRFIDNSASQGGGVYVSESQPSFTNCVFEDNAAATGAGVYTFVSHTSLTGCVFSGNLASYVGGGVATYGGTATLESCVFDDNDAQGSGGAAAWTHSQVTLNRCVFERNIAPGGAAMFVESDVINQAVVVAVNSRFTGNIGDVLLNWTTELQYPSELTLVNCTIAANSGAGLVNFNTSEAMIAGCVFWSNGAVNKAEQLVPGGGSIVASYSCIQNGYKGAGNIAIDPNFADMAAGDFRLTDGSPCIDAGDNTAFAGLPPGADAGDLDGNARFVDHAGTTDTGQGRAPIVDMGAYELQPQPVCTWDLNGDGEVGTADLLVLLGSWDDPYGSEHLVALLGAWGPCNAEG